MRAPRGTPPRRAPCAHCRCDRAHIVRGAEEDRGQVLQAHAAQDTARRVLCARCRCKLGHSVQE